MAGPRKTSPVVRTIIKRSPSGGGIQVRIYSHENHLDKTSVGKDLDQAIKRIKDEVAGRRR